MGLPRFIFNMDYFADYSSFNQFANDYHKFSELMVDPQLERLNSQLTEARELIDIAVNGNMAMEMSDDWEARAKRFLNGGNVADK